MFDSIIKEASNRFNLGDKALPLAQVLVSAMTNPEAKGLTGFIDRFKNNGMSGLVDSWLHSAAPLSINHAQIESVLGGKGGVLETITTQLGIDKGSALLGLSFLLPRLFGQLAPAGNIPATFSSDITGFAQKGLNLSGVVATAVTAKPTAVEAKPDTLTSIVETVGHRFSLGNKAEPLVQSVVAAMTHKETGGLSGFIDGFKKQGLSGLVDSWLNGSAPLSINHAQIEDVLGAKGGLLDTITSKVGLDKGTALLGLSYLLPKLMQQLAPAGNVNADIAPEVSSFAEKGLALLGAGAAVATGTATLNKPAPVAAPVTTTPTLNPVPVPAPAPVVAPVSAPVSTSVPVPTPKPVPVPVPTPVPVPAPTPVITPKVATPIPAEISKGSPFWKNLIWLLPIVLGLFAFKSCSNDTDDNTANTSAVSSAADHKAATEKAVAAPIAVEPKPMAEKTTSNPKPIEHIAIEKAVEAKIKPATDAVLAIPSAKLYFDVDKVDLPSDTADKLAPVIKYLNAHGDAKVSIAGFHDPSGNQAANDDLAKNRAKQVMAKLKAAGIAEKAIMMEKPQSTTGTGTKEEARRVEVTVK